MQWIKAKYAFLCSIDRPRLVGFAGRVTCAFEGLCKGDGAKKFVSLPGFSARREEWILVATLILGARDGEEFEGAILLQAMNTGEPDMCLEAKSVPTEWLDSK